ncbi:hypothetical protein SCUCBS95973_008201 [Sporothrix curviconia]|uniref:Uncharacterized protein n=1 Tax=Sporothrix curviconia TaxID=1260050 RepID=A0ABP0CM31_9PEZI
MSVVIGSELDRHHANLVDVAANPANQYGLGYGYAIMPDPNDPYGWQAYEQERARRKILDAMARQEAEAAAAVSGTLLSTTSMTAATRPSSCLSLSSLSVCSSSCESDGDSDCEDDDGDDKKKKKRKDKTKTCSGPECRSKTLSFQRAGPHWCDGKKWGGKIWGLTRTPGDRKRANWHMYFDPKISKSEIEAICRRRCPPVRRNHHHHHRRCHHRRVKTKIVAVCGHCQGLGCMQCMPGGYLVPVDYAYTADAAGYDASGGCGHYGAGGLPSMPPHPGYSGHPAGNMAHWLVHDDKDSKKKDKDGSKKGSKEGSKKGSKDGSKDGSTSGENTMGELAGRMQTMSRNKKDFWGGKWEKAADDMPKATVADLRVLAKGYQPKDKDGKGAGDDAAKWLWGTFGPGEGGGGPFYGDTGPVGGGTFFGGYSGGPAGGGGGGGGSGNGGGQGEATTSTSDNTGGSKDGSAGSKGRGGPRSSGSAAGAGSGRGTAAVDTDNGGEGPSNSSKQKTPSQISSSKGKDKASVDGPAPAAATSPAASAAAIIDTDERQSRFERLRQRLDDAGRLRTGSWERVSPEVQREREWQRQQAMKEEWQKMQVEAQGRGSGRGSGSGSKKNPSSNIGNDNDKDNDNDSNSGRSLLLLREEDEQALRDQLLPDVSMSSGSGHGSRAGESEFAARFDGAQYPQDPEHLASLARRRAVSDTVSYISLATSTTTAAGAQSRAAAAARTAHSTSGDTGYETGHEAPPNAAGGAVVYANRFDDPGYGSLYDIPGSAGYGGYGGHGGYGRYGECPGYADYANNEFAMSAWGGVSSSSTTLLRSSSRSRSSRSKGGNLDEKEKSRKERSKDAKRDRDKKEKEHARWTLCDMTA